MIPILSLVTSVKDYLEVVHKLIEYDSININYTELGSILTYFFISLKNCAVDFFSLLWLKNLWSLPIIIPDISSAMISEISVLDGYFHNAFLFLDTPVSYGEQNNIVYCLEKFSIGLINSLFLFLPTSTAHIITLRRFVMQGLEAGYVSGLGAIVGNMFWLASIIFGWRFFVIPWLSLDIFRYVLGFILLVKYMWDSYNERKTTLSVEDDLLKKQKMFLLTFLLALTEQTSIYPFISNFSFSNVSLLETFPAENLANFVFVHFSYLLGIGLGSLSLLHFSCWFWENPAFKLYMWVISSFKVSTSFYYKLLNFGFLYLTMLSAITSIPYYGLDYTITNPLGYVSDDRIIQDKVVLETSFLGTKASDRNTRRNRGRHGRRERWKRRIRKYRTFDASLYDQGIYDLFTIEDLNYGFDRFWLRRKLRNHRVRFRFFPGPWMRSFKKQLAKPRLESYTGPRIEFFRILFEQVYHPSFHSYTFKGMQRSSLLPNPEGVRERGGETLYTQTSNSQLNEAINKGSLLLTSKKDVIYSINKNNLIYNNLIYNNLKKSTLRKFVRKVDSRLKSSQIISKHFNTKFNGLDQTLFSQASPSLVPLFGREQQINPLLLPEEGNRAGVASYIKSLNFLVSPSRFPAPLAGGGSARSFFPSAGDPQGEGGEQLLKKQNVRKNLSKKDYHILRYRSLLTAARRGGPLNDFSINKVNNNSQMLLHPLKFYLQQEAGLKRKYRYYTPNIYRKFGIENNAPYFRVMLKRYFYNYKPTLRWERTMRVASLRKARRKTTRIPRKLQYNGTINKSLNELFPVGSETLSPAGGLPLLPESTLSDKAALQKSSYNYSVVSKKASRYRYQIYKDVLQHWYYSPFNRFLLKLDVDSFIRRQPQGHFLTEKEENLLHLRRFLLSEHYNTLRWYTNMEHYRSMKTQLNGSTKSFSSRVYNQQFAGTFKKIRHLFAITPSQSGSFLSGNTTPAVTSLIASSSSPILAPKPLSLPYSLRETPRFPRRGGVKETSGGNEPVVLKFDQPLYNEFINTNNNPLLNPLIIHEELLKSPLSPLLSLSLSRREREREQGAGQQGVGFFGENMGQSERVDVGKGEDLLTQAQSIVRDYLIKSRGERENYIKQLLNENNYLELTRFIYKGQKIRGNQPVTNQRLLNTQEKDYLLDDFDFSLKGVWSEKQAASFGTNSSPKTSANGGPSLPAPSPSPSPSPVGSGSGSGSGRGEQGVSGGSVSDRRAIPKEGRVLKLTNKKFMEDLYLTYLKKWKRRVNDQEALKNYLTRRIDKREKRKTLKEKQLTEKLKRLQNWLYSSNIQSTKLQTSSPPYSLQSSARFPLSLPKGEKGQQGVRGSSLSSLTPAELGRGQGTSSQEAKEQSETASFTKIQKDLLTSGLRKSILEGMFVLNKVDSNVISSKKEENNLWKVLLLSNIYNIQKEHNFNIEKREEIEKKALEERESPGRKGMRFNDLQLMQNKKTLNEILTSTEQLNKILNNTYLNTGKNDKNSFSSRGVSLKARVRMGETKENFQNQRRGPYLEKSKILTLKAKGFYLYNMLKNTKSPKMILNQNIFNYLGLNKMLNIIKPIKRKSLKDWRKKERALGKQKRSRKEFKLLGKKAESRDLFTYFDGVPKGDLSLSLQTEAPSRKKRDPDPSAVIAASSTLLSPYKESTPLRGREEATGTFKRKRTPQRRARIRRARGVFRKRTLNDSLKQDFREFEKNKYISGLIDQKFYEKINQKLYSLKPVSVSSSDNELSPSAGKQQENSKRLDSPGAPTPGWSIGGGTAVGGDNPVSPPKGGQQGRGPQSQNYIKENELKQRKSKQRKQRSWKQKRAKFSQKRKKYRKRRRYTLNKIRTLNKQFKKVKNIIEIQNWWWKQFIPSIQASTEALWQIEKDILIQEKLSQLSTDNLLEKDYLNNLQTLQVGNKDFKPLALPETINTLQLLSPPKGTVLKSAASQGPLPQAGAGAQPSPVGSSEGPDGASLPSPSPVGSGAATPGMEVKNELTSNFSIINKLYENLFINKDFTTEFKELMLPNTGLPFYAGWDESLRKFVVTNRMLSRQDAGYEMQAFPSGQNSIPALKFLTNFAQSGAPALPSPVGSSEVQGRGPGSEKIIESQSGLLSKSSLEKVTVKFNQAPLQGMNAATTLYWQIPFTTYDPDQFFALGMDGFSPIGWRKFLFRHSILKTWLNTLNTNKSNMEQGASSAKVGKFIDPSGLNNTVVNSGRQEPLDNSSPSPAPEGRGRGSEQERVVSLPQQPKVENNVRKEFVKKELIVSPFNQGTKNILDLLNEKQVISSLYLSLTPYPAAGDSQGVRLERGGALPSSSDSKKAFAFSRHLKKRYRRVKKHPRTPVWFPSGPLLNQVLPVHYIYVFYKRARLPRDRYLKRRLINVKSLSNSRPSAGDSQGGAFNLLKEQDTDYTGYDFTLRKRLKPRRKYHLKRDSSNIVIPRRLRFMTSPSLFVSPLGGANEAKEERSSRGPLPQPGAGAPGLLSNAVGAAAPSLPSGARGGSAPREERGFASPPSEGREEQFTRWRRPLAPLKLNKPIAEIVKEQKFLRAKQRRKELSSKQPNIRVKQLRRRIQRQVLRSVWRYRPRAGGFVWPGDYLKLELVKAPKLQTVDASPNGGPPLPAPAPYGRGRGEGANRSAGDSQGVAGDSQGVKGSLSKGRKGNLDEAAVPLSNESRRDSLGGDGSLGGSLREEKRSSKKRSRKKNVSSMEWQIQPKKYLYEKHNKKVLKQKLKKAHRIFNFYSQS